MRTVSVLIRQDLLTKLDFYCRQNQKNRSAVIRDAVIGLLKEEKITPVEIPSFYPFSPLKRITAKFPEGLIKKLEQRAMEHGITMSDIIRTAIYDLVKDIKIAPGEEKKVMVTYTYWCPFCGAVFARKYALKIHLRRIHKGFPYCPVCLVQFKAQTPTNHFKKYKDPLHLYWYDIIRKSRSPRLTKAEEE